MRKKLLQFLGVATLMVALVGMRFPYTSVYRFPSHYSVESARRVGKYTILKLKADMADVEKDISSELASRKLPREWLEPWRASDYRDCIFITTPSYDPIYLTDDIDAYAHPEESNNGLPRLTGNTASGYCMVAYCTPETAVDRAVAWIHSLFGST